MTCRTAATPACSSRLAASRQSLAPRRGDQLHAQRQMGVRADAGPDGRGGATGRPGRRSAASAGPCWRGPAGTGRPASGPGRRWAWRAPAWRARSARRSARTAPARRGRRDGVPAGPAAPRRRASGCPPPGGRANTAPRNASPGGADAARRPGGGDHERGAAARRVARRYRPRRGRARSCTAARRGPASRPARATVRGQPPAWVRRAAGAGPIPGVGAPAAPDACTAPSRNGQPTRCRQGERACAAGGRRSASVRTRRTARRARGSSRWCRSPASARTGHRLPPWRCRLTSRRRCGRGRATGSRSAEFLS